MGLNDPQKRTIPLSLSNKEYRYFSSEEEKEVNRAKQDPKDFRPLYNRYYGRIYGFLFKRVNDEEVAADLASQTFLNALLNLKKYEFRGLPFSAWLYRIASNLCTDYFRESKRQRGLYLDPDKSSELLQEVVEWEEENDELGIWLLKLPMVFHALNDKEVEMIELRFFEQLPFKEIGFITGLNESHARIKTYRILKKMKKLIEAHEAESQNIA